MKVSSETCFDVSEARRRVSAAVHPGSLLASKAS